tara:strand:+ start:719 stop:1345 length:627 start_codon:yes stop_codon:yes gene_type:complete
MKIKEPKKGYEKITKSKARLVAHLIGDGCVYNHKGDYNIKYEVVDKELLDLFFKDLLEVYGLIPFRGFTPSGKTQKLIPYVRLRSRRAYDDLMRFATYFSSDWKIKNTIMNSPLYIKREFLRAIFDDEGSVIPEGKKAIIRLYSINYKGLKQVEKLLNEFEIMCIMRKGFGEKRNVFALTLKDICKFRKHIGFKLLRKNRRLDSFLNK